MRLRRDTLRIPARVRAKPGYPEPRMVLSLVLPTYNESKNIETAIKRVSRVLNSVIAGSYEILVVDDDSPDRTWEIAQGLTRQFPRVRVIRRTGFRDLSSAVILGWQKARGGLLGVMDADLQHPPEALRRMLKVIKEKDADLVIASRYVKGGRIRGWSFFRRIISRGAQILALLCLPEVASRVSDPMSGYFILRRRAIARCLLKPSGYKILLEVLGRGRIYHAEEIGYVFRERKGGASKMTARIYLQYVFHLIRLRLGVGAVGRFARFGSVGGSGVVVDMSLLYFLHDPAALGLGLTLSKMIAAEAAIVNNFIWNDLWTFRDRVQDQRGKRLRGKRFLKFNMICGAGLVMNIIFLNIFANLFYFHYLVANLMAILLVMLWNFWVNDKLNWRVSEG